MPDKVELGDAKPFLVGEVQQTVFDLGVLTLTPPHLWAHHSKVFKGSQFKPRVADPDTHCFRKMEPDQHYLSQNSGAPSAQMEQWRAADAHNGGVEAQNGALEGLYTSGRQFASL